MTTHEAVSDRTRLAPEDALSSRHGTPSLDGDSLGPNGDGLRKGIAARRTKEQRKNRSRSRRRKGAWKKLLWVRQSYPDNYTDEETFLDALQRNPRLRPYEFWPLVADSTVIVQQVCTMVVFVCCFSGIIQDRVSPITVVSVGTVGTVLGWVLWDIWVGQEQALNATVEVRLQVDDGLPSTSVSHKDLPCLGHASKSASLKDLQGLSQPSAAPSSSNVQGLGEQSRATSNNSRPTLAALTPTSSYSSSSKGHSRRPSGNSVKLSTISEPPHQPPTHLSKETSSRQTSHSYYPPLGDPDSKLSPRNQQRLATAKSAVLIYCALLGLSPILKSLTRSTASDSIWAISFWLMCINVVFFDYGGGVGATFPASLSTNAALMASTVLASRLPSTTHVFSLTLFSIEVFGLFPVFRRYLRHISWDGHLCLTIFLVMAAGAGVAISVTGGGWRAAIVGTVLGSLLMGLFMGLCSWWLIGLQRYKNEIYGPWDPARPILRRWD